MGTMTFRNVGGVHQLQVVDDEDLSRIDKVDPARWAATSAPLADLHCDPAFLAYLDPDGTKRIRASQVVVARDWLFERLKDRTRVRNRTDVLHVADLDVSREAGMKLKKAVEHVIAATKTMPPDRLPLATLREFRASYVKTLANGDGIVCPEVLGHDPEVAAFVKSIMATVGSSKDASGFQGVGEPELAKFLEHAKAYLDWKAKPTASPAIFAWGEETPAAAELVRELDAKVEEFFWHCDLVRQEALAGTQPRLDEKEVKALKSKDAAAIEAYLAGSPLATPNPEGTLALEGAVNPVYAERFEALRAKTLGRALEPATRVLTRASWRKVKAVFESYYAWQREKPSEPFDKVPEAELRATLEGSLVARLRAAIEVDKAAALELDQLSTIEKFILYQRWLIELVNNFVNLSAIYHPQHTALMERGSLVIDGRRLEFCVKVDKRDEHKKVATDSLLFLVYAQVFDKDGGAPVFEVVAPLTSGERGRLRVGKRGIFIDNADREWDAIVVDLVENPISIREAFKAPFRRMSAFVHKKIEDLAAAHLAAAEKTASEHADQATTAVVTPPAAAAPPAPGAAPAAPGPMGGLQNVVLIGGLVISGLTAALAFVLQAISNMNLLRTAFGLGMVALIIGSLSAFLGWLKLRRRDMSLILEANGWALNVPMKVTRRLGGLFAHVPPIPKGARIDRIPAEGARARRIVVAAWLSAIAVVACFFSWLATRPGGFEKNAHELYKNTVHRVETVRDGIADIFSLNDLNNGGAKK